MPTRADARPASRFAGPGLPLMRIPFDGRCREHLDRDFSVAIGTPPEERRRWPSVEQDSPIQGSEVAEVLNSVWELLDVQRGDRVGKGIGVWRDPR